MTLIFVLLEEWLLAKLVSLFMTCIISQCLRFAIHFLLNPESYKIKLMQGNRFLWEEFSMLQIFKLWQGSICGCSVRTKPL